ncbi:MAG: hypothetical protein QXJ06_03560 [Candidatus Aenigmatarchaeota archaeon]
MKKIMVIIVSLMVAIMISGMGSKAGAEDVETGIKSVSNTGQTGYEVVNKRIVGEREENDLDEILDFSKIKANQIKVKKIIKLTDDKVGYANPQWSPDGRYIAFTKAGAGGNLWIMDIRTKKKIEITNSDKGGTKFYWSPDSDKIAFINRRKIKGRYKNIIAIAQIDEKDFKKKEEEIIEETTDEIEVPLSNVWSIAGDKITYKKGKEKRIIEKRLKDKIKPNIKDLNILWLKKKKVIEKDKKIYIQDEKGNEIKIAEYGYNPEIIEDGKVRYQIDENLYVVYDGEKRKVIKKMYFKEGSQGKTEIKERFISENITFLNSKFIIYADIKDDGHVILSSKLKIKDLVENKSYDLINDPKIIPLEPELSEDGRYITFVNEYNGDSEIYIAELYIKK